MEPLRETTMNQLAKFAIEVRDEDFVLHLEDQNGHSTQYSATPEQLDAVIDALDELLSEGEEEFFEVEEGDRPN
jgi:hypothetical protein